MPVYLYIYIFRIVYIYLLGQSVKIEKLLYLETPKAFILTFSFRIKSYLENGTVLKMGIVCPRQIPIFSS